MTETVTRRSFPPLLDVTAMDDTELRYWLGSITRLLWQHRSSESLSDRGRLAAELTRLRAEYERRQGRPLI